MPVLNTHRFRVDARSKFGVPLGDLDLNPDWETVLECARLSGIRNGRLPPMLDGGMNARVVPQWHPSMGAPFVSGAKMTFGEGTPEEWSFPVPKTYFRRAVTDASGRLVETGLIRQGELIDYVLCAFPDEEVTNPENADGVGEIDVEHGIHPISVDERSLAEALAGAERRGSDYWQQEDIPVLIHGRVLAEACALSREAGGFETGGVLVGRLYRDPKPPEVFAEIRAQVWAPHTKAAAAKLTFTTDTWAAVADAIKLRRQDEMMLGWWHCHPNFCARCPEERRRLCHLSRPFFSQDDRFLHRAVFQGAFNVALLVSDLDDDLSVDLFGWRGGEITQRGFYVLPDSCS